MPRPRALIKLLAALTLIFLATVAWIGHRYDAAWARQELVRLVEEKTQLRLTLAENPQLSWFPDLELSLGKASLSEPHSPESFARIGRARVTLQLIPLLSGKIVMDQIEIEEAHLLIVRHRDGSLNLGSWFKTAPSASPAHITVGIGTIKLTGSIEFRDQRHHQDWRGRNITLSAGPIGPNASGSVALAGEIVQGQLIGQGTIRARYQLDLARGYLDMNEIDSIWSGQLNPQTSFRTRLTASSLQKLANRLSVQDLKGHMEAQGKEMNIVGTLSMPDLRIQSDSHLETPLLSLQYHLRQGSNRIRGQLASSAHASLEMREYALPDIAGEIELENPAALAQKIHLHFSGTLAASHRPAALSGTLKSHFDQTNASADWQLSGLHPLSLRLNLNIDQLNLNRYLPSQPNLHKEHPSPPIPPLAAGNIAGQLRIGSLHWGSQHIQSLRIEWDLANHKPVLPAPQAPGAKNKQQGRPQP